MGGDVWSVDLAHPRRVKHLGAGRAHRVPRCIGMKKILLVYNPQASNAAVVEDEVLTQTRALRGYLVGKYKVQKTDFKANVAEIVPMIGDGDLVVAVGGDGTANLALNAMAQSGMNAVFAVLGYGNFNDMAGMLGMARLDEVVERYEKGEVLKVHPLEVKVNGEVWRYALCYISAGLLAEATTLMENAKTRKKLTTKSGRVTWLAWWWAVKWYLKNHRRRFLMQGKLNGWEFGSEMTDYLAVNGPTLARVIRGGNYWRDEKRFGSAIKGLGKFWKMVGFGLRSINRRKGLDLTVSEGDRVEFGEGAAIGLQVEGEYEKMDDVRTIEVKKTIKALKIVANAEQ